MTKIKRSVCEIIDCHYSANAESRNDAAADALLTSRNDESYAVIANKVLQSTIQNLVLKDSKFIF